MPADWDSSHSETVEAVYRSVLRPDGWAEPLDRLAALMNARSGVVMAIDTRNVETNISGYSSHFATIPAELEHWRQNYSHHDERGYANLMTKAATGFHSGMKLMGAADEAADLANPSVAYGAKHMGWQHRAATRLSTHGAWLDMLAVQFAPGRAGITPEEAATGAPFIAHFAQAVEMVRAFQMLRAQYQVVVGALDHLRIGMAIVLGEGEVAVDNRSVQAMTEDRDGLYRDPRGRLRAWRDEDAMTLESAIRNATATAAGRGRQSRAQFTVQRQSGLTPYLVTVAPLADDGVELDPRFRGAMVTIIDPDNRAAVSTQGLSQIYGLTAQEAEIADGVARGRSIAAIAESAGTDVGTARGALRAVLAKTKSASRADLVRLAVMIDLPIDPVTGAD